MTYQQTATRKTGKRQKAGKSAAQKRRLAKVGPVQVLAFAAVAFVMVCVIRMPSISARGREIARLNDEVSSLESNRQYLAVSLSARENSQRIYDEAVQRLGMVYPDAAQVCLVSVPGMTGADVKTAYDGRSEVRP